MPLPQRQVSQLYVSIFGRVSEGEGNDYWAATQDSMVDCANTMLATSAAKDYFGDTLDDDRAFIYENTLGKNYAEDPGGISLFSKVLDDVDDSHEAVESGENHIRNMVSPDKPHAELDDRWDIQTFYLDRVISLEREPGEAFVRFEKDDATRSDGFFSVDLVEGHRYNIQSHSIVEPHIFILADREGDALATDNIDRPDAKAVIDGFVAPYTGTFFINAGWSPGVYHDYASISVYEKQTAVVYDYDTVSIVDASPQADVHLMGVPDPQGGMDPSFVVQG